jgi:NMD protein affecting ribosome stability and mRNA decay
MKKQKQKQCRHCGTIDNLRTNKNGVVYNCCVKCYKEIEVPSQMKLTSEALMNKYRKDYPTKLLLF